jgi:hypothetical protein
MTGTSKYLWIGIIVTITSIVAIGSAVAFDKAYAGGYDRNQAVVGTNDCGNEFIPTNVLCFNTGSEVQGDENAVALASRQQAPISLLPDMITDGFLTIKEAIIKPFGEPNPPEGNTDGGLEAFLKTHGLIPENGEGGAFGYGVITTNTLEGDGSLIVATTHAGVLDSSTQNGDANNPIWHNHFVTLKEDQTNCGDDPAVDAITFEQPGSVEIEGKTAKLLQIPNQFTSPDSLTMMEITLEPGNEVQDVVSFKLAPVFGTSNELLAVCVTDITSAENVIIE